MLRRVATHRSSNCSASADLARLRALINRERGEIVGEARDVALAESCHQRRHGRCVVARLALEVEQSLRQVVDLLPRKAWYAAVAPKITQVAGDARARIECRLYSRLHGR